MNRTRASTTVLATLAFLSLAAGGCVTPDTVVPDDAGSGNGSGGATGVGGSGTTGQGGTRGSGGSTGGNGSGGAIGGTGGTAGRTGTGGSTGVGGGTVIGPAPTLMDDFETGDVTMRWISDSPTNNALNPSSAPGCGDWAVVTDPTLATNHVFQQRSACSSSNPSWSAGGKSSWTDMRLQARVLFGAGSSTSTRITLGVRFVNDRTQYYLEFTNDGKIKIRARSETGTASSDITNASNGRVVVPDGQWTTIALAISGTTASVYLGDDRTAPPVLTGPVSGATIGGVALGVASGTASFDDILVTAP